MQESKSCALPLGDTPISKQVLTVAQRVELLAARVELAYLRDNRYPLVEHSTGVEPATYALLVRCSAC